MYIVNRLRIGSKVSALRSSTTLKKVSPVSQSIPPNTHFPLTGRPLLNFCFPNFDSLISTICPGPPIFFIVQLYDIQADIAAKIIPIDCTLVGCY